MKFRATTLEYAPRVTNLNRIQDQPGKYTAEGIFPDVFNELKRIMNFTYSLTKSPDGQWGAILPNGSWTGMVKDLQNDVFDIGIQKIQIASCLCEIMINLALCDLAVTKSRARVITFSVPLTEDYYQLFIKNPLRAYNFQAYTEPLDNLCWLVIAMFCAVTPFVLWYSSK